MYNIDNRVERVLSKEKPTPAPKFPVDQQQFQSADAESNVASPSIHKKNDQLLEYLHDVKVYSKGDNPIIRRVDDASHHPTSPPLLNRLEESLDDESPDGAFGYVEPQRIPPGRISLRQFLAYLQQHRDNPQEYTIDRFVDMYAIKRETAEKVFKNHTLLALQEFKRQQSQAPARPPHVAAGEVFTIEAEVRRKPGNETGFTSKY